MACSSSRGEGRKSSWQATGRHSISECHSSPSRPPTSSLSPASIFLSVCSVSVVWIHQKARGWAASTIPPLCHSISTTEEESELEEGSGHEVRGWRVNSGFASHYVVARQLFLHMTALSDGRPPFGTKTESWGRERRGAESSTEMRGDLVNTGTDTLLLSLKQYKAT